MNIFLDPIRPLVDHEIVVSKSGDILTVDYQRFDFSPLQEGDTLPRGAVNDQIFPGEVSRVNGAIELTLRMPIPVNYSQEQAFPVPLLDVPNGRVMLPGPDVPADETYSPINFNESLPIADVNIDWSKLVTKSMKDATLAAAQLVAAKADLAERNTRAVVQIARVQDRIDTIGMGIEIGEATPEDEAEQAALLLTLKAWKTYKYALGKVTVQPTWYQAPVWPIEPPIPEIIAAPMLAAVESI